MRLGYQIDGATYSGARLLRDDGLRRDDERDEHHHDDDHGSTPSAARFRLFKSMYKRTRYNSVSVILIIRVPRTPPSCGTARSIGQAFFAKLSNSLVSGRHRLLGHSSHVL